MVTCSDGGDRVVNAECVGERGTVSRRCDGLAAMRPTPAPGSSESVFAVVSQVHLRCKDMSQAKASKTRMHGRSVSAMVLVRWES